MATKKRPVLIRVQPYNYEKLKAIADGNRRSVSNQLEYLMEQFIANYEMQYGQIPLTGEEQKQNNVPLNKQIGNNNFFSVGSGNVTINTD